MTWLQSFHQLYRWRRDMEARLRRYSGLVDWIRDFDQLWEMSGQTKWQTHPSVPLLFALPDLHFFFFSPVYQCWCSQSVTVIAWQHNLPKMSHNAPRKLNLISKPDRPIWQEARVSEHLCQYVCVCIVCVCVCIQYMFAKSLNPRSICWINQRSTFE